MKFHKLYLFNYLIFIGITLKNFYIIAQPDVRKKGVYNPTLSEGRLNTDAQQTFIKGKVLDRLSNEPLIGATVKLFPKGIVSYTDLNGYFEFLNLPPDTFEIEINYIGYKKTRFSDISTTEKQMVQLILPVEILVSEMEGVVIESEIPKLSELSALMLQKNSNYISEGQSGNQLDKENFDYAVSTSFQRMNGASFVGNFSYVRGLTEKYNAVLLNNAPYLSLNPQQYYLHLNDMPSQLIAGMQILKSTTSEFYSNYSGGIISLETESMPEASKLKFQWSSFYNTLSTFKRLCSFPFNRKLLFIPETQNIPVPIRKQPLLNNHQIPNYFKNRTFTAIPSTQWGAYLTKRMTAFNNRDLGLVAAINFWDHYQRHEVTGEEILNVTNTLNVRKLKNTFLDKHHQNATALTNFSLKWNIKNFLQSKNLITYKNENQVYTQETDSNFYRSQGFQRNFTFAQQNSGQHSLVSKKNRSLRLEWLQFYHYYYQQVPSFNNLYFYHNPSNEMLLSLPNATTENKNKLYHQNLVYTEKQTVHQVGGDLFFDVMVKEDDNKAKTKIGTFINYTYAQFNSRNFHYRLSNNFVDSSLISMNSIFTNGIMNANETEFVQFELTDSSNLFQAGHINFAPYVQIQYELTEVFHFVVGFREDFSFRKLNNFKKTNLLQRATQSDLPSLSIIFRTHEKSQLRFNYMMTVTRPSDRDLIGSKFFHPFMQILQLPNPNLLHSTTNHLDGRFEFYPNITDAFSVNLFFKQIHFPIENVYNVPITYEQVLTTNSSNSNAAILGGMEWEWKQNLGNIINSLFFEKFYLYFNGYASFSNTKPSSQMKFFSETTRPLQGHSNYGLNFGINWSSGPLGLKVMTFINHKGKHLFLAHSNDFSKNIWELQRTDGSIQVSKSYQAHWEFRLAVFNVLNQPIRWAFLGKNHYFKNSVTQMYREQKLGQQILISVNYRL